MDRDGVINEVNLVDGVPRPPKSMVDLVLLPDVIKSLNQLKNANYYLAVITNQPDVARGHIAKNEVDKINQYLLSILPLDVICCCYHDDVDLCNCRKPKPGAILKLAREQNLDLSSSYMIGDRWRDIDAGGYAGCRTIMIDYGYAEKPRSIFLPNYKVGSLAEACKIILWND